MLDPGTQVGRYEIQRRLGRGGMGAVYVAHDPLLGRMVAIKVFSGELDLPEAHERFSREARSAAALNHPNIVTVHDYGEYASQPYIVMEYVPGETLAHMIRRKAPVSLSEKLTWLEELCAGADYAHKMSVIHRDIKPSNLIIDRSGRLKILDFGIARVMGSGSNTTGVVGTPGYMAPEQILDGPIDHRADLFSIGVVAYELLAYAEAFPGETIASITHRVVTAEPEDLAQQAPQAPPDIIATVQRLLRKVPSDRFSDAESVRLTVSRIRRRLEPDSSVIIAPTVIRPPKVTPTGGDRPSPQRGSTASSPAPSTPTPRPTSGRKKTDREALARRRDEQRTAALDRARAALAQNDLESAYDACQQALTFDEQHPDALALEDAIHAAFAARDRPVDPDGGVRSLDVVADVPVNGRPSSVSRHNTNGSPTGRRESGALESPQTNTSDGGKDAPATPAPALHLVDRTVVAPAPVLGNRAVGAAEVGATVVAPRDTPPPRPAPPPAPSRQPLAQYLYGRAHQLTAAVVAAVHSRFSALALLVSLRLTRRQKLAAAGVLGAVAVAAAATVFLMTSRPAPSGTLLVDAVPWGTITSIESTDGERLSVPPPAATPLSLALPPGEYDVVVTGPPPQSQVQRIHVRIDAEATSTPATVRFHVVTPEEYFEAYLAASEAPQPVEGEPVEASVSQ